MKNLIKNFSMKSHLMTRKNGFLQMVLLDFQICEDKPVLIKWKVSASKGYEY
ncbi:hypothetical protein D8674_041761 [Pyrus ussuriensis x Pyrus communis]|uniref:Uncharacterized protein n=1 Tax=Pyrus ussuriensis x Pyrus communis TaxID=2448454 RepID=A0A5N5H902_9ROSA|nr:hypothetical protein D8674_041761 [Pyrus ussuriensis x Pyrus communis]